MKLVRQCEITTCKVINLLESIIQGIGFFVTISIISVAIFGCRCCYELTKTVICDELRLYDLPGVDGAVHPKGGDVIVIHWPNHLDDLSDDNTI
jgi:hypothetical protein